MTYLQKRVIPITTYTLRVISILRFCILNAALFLIIAVLILFIAYYFYCVLFLLNKNKTQIKRKRRNKLIIANHNKSIIYKWVNILTWTGNLLCHIQLFYLLNYIHLFYFNYYILIKKCYLCLLFLFTIYAITIKKFQ